MVPENIMTKDPDSESGFSINHDVLNQLLKKMSSSIIKKTDMPEDQVECRECENEDEEPQDNHEEYAEDNSRYHQAENSNYHQQSTKQTSRSKYSIISPQQNVRLEEKRAQEHTPICEYVDSGKETLSTPYQQAPQTVHRRQDEPPKPYQTSGVEYQTISGQYPFTEFSPKSFDQFKQTKVPSTNQYFIQDSSRGMQRRYEQQQPTTRSSSQSNMQTFGSRGMQQRYEQQQSTTRPSSQSNMQTFEFSGRQPTPNIQYVQPETCQREEPTADCCQYGQNSFRTPEPSQPPQEPSQPSPRLQLGNVSVRRASYPNNS